MNQPGNTDGPQAVGHIAEPKSGFSRMIPSGAISVLSKDTHEGVRFAPPLVIARADLDWALDRFEEVVHELERAPQRRAAA